MSWSPNRTAHAARVRRRERLRPRRRLPECARDGSRLLSRPGLCCGKKDGNPRTGARVAGDVEFTLHLPNDGPADREPQSVAIALGGKERFKNPRQMLGQNATPRVDD